MTLLDDDGYEEGHAIGYEEGYDYGYTQGESDGFESGYDVAIRDILRISGVPEDVRKQIMELDPWA